MRGGSLPKAHTSATAREMQSSSGHGCGGASVSAPSRCSARICRTLEIECSSTVHAASMARSRSRASSSAATAGIVSSTATADWMLQQGVRRSWPVATQRAHRVSRCAMRGCCALRCCALRELQHAARRTGGEKKIRKQALQALRHAGIEEDQKSVLRVRTRLDLHGDVALRCAVGAAGARHVRTARVAHAHEVVRG